MGWTGDCDWIILCVCLCRAQSRWQIQMKRQTFRRCGKVIKKVANIKPQIIFHRKTEQNRRKKERVSISPQIFGSFVWLWMRLHCMHQTIKLHADQTGWRFCLSGTNVGGPNGTHIHYVDLFILYSEWVVWHRFLSFHSSRRRIQFLRHIRSSSSEFVCVCVFLLNVASHQLIIIQKRKWQWVSE